MTPFWLVFAVATLLAWAAFRALAPGRSPALEGRLKALARAGGSALPAPAAPRGRGLLAGLARRFEPLAERLRFARRLEGALERGGMPWKVGEFMALVAASAAAGAAAGYLALGVPGGLAGAPLGAAVPLLRLKRRIGRRRSALADQLPDALMLMVNALRAGNSLTQSMNVVSQQMPAPIAPQFAATLMDINYGLPVEEALAGLQEDFGGVDMALVVSAILVSRETGGNLSEILGNLQKTIRDRQAAQAEMKALTAQGRLSGWVLSLLPVGIGGIFFVINRPYVMLLFQDPRGQTLVAAAAALTLVGMLAIRKIVNVEY